MDTSRTCSTCDSTADERLETGNSYVNYHSSRPAQPHQQQQHYTRNTAYNQTPLVGQQQYYATQSRASPYKMQGYENQAYGSYAYLPQYYSPYNTFSQQPQLPANNRAVYSYHQQPAQDLRYMMQQPQFQQSHHNLYYQKQQFSQRLEQPQQLVQYVNSEMNTTTPPPLYKNVQHQMCQTNSLATSLFNDDYTYNCQNIVDVATYDVSQQQRAHSQHSQQKPQPTQMMKKVGSVESNLRFINLYKVIN